MTPEHERARWARYNHSEKGRARKRRYQSRYRNTLRGLLAEVRHNTQRRGAA